MRQLSEAARRELEKRREALARAVVTRIGSRQPRLMIGLDEAQTAKCAHDVAFHLSYLDQAAAVGRPALFIDYVAWAKILFAGLGLPSDFLVVTLESMRDVLQQELTADQFNVLDSYLLASLKRLPDMPEKQPSFLDQNGALLGLARKYLSALLKGERQQASRMILKAVKAGTKVQDVYLQVFQRCQYEIGRLWEMNQISVAEEHYCTAATQQIMSQLYPFVFSSPKNGRVLLATCAVGELHELGIRMVADFFEMEGWDTYYLGADTPLTDVLRMAADRQADLLAISATITPHVLQIANTVAAARASRLLAGLKILVGGYPFQVSPNLWRQLGADGSAADARQALQVADQLVTGRSVQ